jgi:hypothetical protein
MNIDDMQPGKLYRVERVTEPMEFAYVGATGLAIMHPPGEPDMQSAIAAPAEDCSPAGAEIGRYDTICIGPVDDHSTLTFAPVDRTGLLAMREAIDRALAAPGEPQKCKATFGGALCTVALSCAEDGGA